MEDIDVFVRWTARLIEVAGIAAIVVGAFTATAHFAARVRAGFDEAYRCYRKHLGQAILLGLELLVAADIIGTVAIEPTLANVGVLAGIVLIRTFLSFSMELEISGRWPWQSSRK